MSKSVPRLYVCDENMKSLVRTDKHVKHVNTTLSGQRGAAASARAAFIVVAGDLRDH